MPATQAPTHELDVWLAASPYRPMAHAPTHALVVWAPTSPYRPAGQGMQADAPVPLYCPAGQMEAVAEVEPEGQM